MLKTLFRGRRLYVIAGFFLVAVLLGLSYVREIRLITSQPVTIWKEDVSADCAVTLTGGPQRIREGIDLLSKKAILKLIISGVNPQSGLRDIFPQAPYYGDLRDQDVILERRSQTTFGNAQQTLPLVEALRCRDLVLITSRIHMRRALQTFKAEFPPHFPIIARAVPAITEPPSWDEVGWEALKSLFYSSWAY
ncbi:MAG: YdcF family protein [Proteobacteria bacterium]|nr:MAG: YdcF family protein [Pseudomonadota bacterium]